MGYYEGKEKEEADAVGATLNVNGALMACFEEDDIGRNEE